MRNGHRLSDPRVPNRQPRLTKLTQALFCRLNRQPWLTIWKDFSISFSHHIIILTEEKNIEKRWKYISLPNVNTINDRDVTS